MLYDIPGRTGMALETNTIVRLSEHPRIVAIKDAKGDFQATSWVRARSDIAVYSGDDAATLPLLALGAVGVVGVTSHIASPQIKAMIEAFDNGNPGEARDIHLRLMPAFTGLFRTQGVILAKGRPRAAGAAVRAGPATPRGRNHRPGRPAEGGPGGRRALNRDSGPLMMAALRRATTPHRGVRLRRRVR